MSQIKEIIATGKTWSYHGGVHPPGRKSLSNKQPIQPLFIPDELIIPIRQHIGEGGCLLVSAGDQVLKGQPLTQPPHRMSLPVHASTSGIVKAIEERPIAHASGLNELCLIIEPDGKEQWCELAPIADYTQLSKHDLLERIRDAGISGMGGAGFPTATKLGLEKPIELLLLNAAECEPYITADDMLMREHAPEIIQGAQIIAHILNNPLVVVGIEDNKPEAAEALRQAAKGTDIVVRVVPTKYPTGGEKQLIEVVTGLQVPSGGLPADIGIVVQNIASAFAIKEAVIDGKPLVQRVMTVTGLGVANPGNYWTLIGTPANEVLTRQQVPVEQKTVMGGPMMGFVLMNNRIPIVKTSNCLIVPDGNELHLEPTEMPCIRCGCCAEVCPVQLLPQQLGWYAKAEDEAQLKKHNLFDCIECGACAFTCSSEIPLVLYFRQAKAFVKGRALEQQKAEQAKERNDAKKARIEREKQERLAKRKAGAASTRKQTSQADAGAKDAVAAALARAKARKATSGDQPDDMAAAREARKAQARQAKQAKAESAEAKPADEAKAKVAAAIARAKAKKAAAQDEPVEAAPAPSAEDDKKAKVAAAIARAKAKKAAAQGEPVEAVSAPSAEDEKKAKIAAAIARAKAKKAAAQGEPVEAAPAPSAEDDKKAKVAAAIARAKAKKAAAQGEPVEAAPAPSAEDDKKAKVAAAIARAKAKKAAAQDEPVEAAPAPSAEDEKKAKVAAAIARAKAKKAAAQGEPVEAAPAPSAEDEKKAKIAAAIARAKAKKAAKEMEQANDHDV